MKSKRFIIYRRVLRIYTTLFSQSTFFSRKFGCLRFACACFHQTQRIPPTLPALQGFLDYRFHQPTGFSPRYAMDPTDSFQDFEGESDPELRAAIAASLRDINQTSPNASASAQNRQIVDLTEDSEREEDDEELKAAIALSLGAQNGVSEGPVAEEDITSTAPSSHTSLGILGLDRKKMEEERLARLTKRKAEQNPVSPPPPRRQKRHEIEASEPGFRSSAISPTTTSAVGTHTLTSSPSSAPGVQYPRGVVKKTWAFGIPRAGDDIKIEEVLQRTDLELAILSSFLWDLEWLLSKMNTASTRFLLVMQAKDEQTRRQYETESASFKNIRLCFPPMEGQVNCMHSKLMVLFHKDYARVVIPSANLVPFDWGESGGIMENTVFLIDLPKLQNSTNNSEPQTKFHEDLNYFLRASTLHENLISKLAAFDFAETARYAFVHTIGGSHTGEQWKLTGYCGLGRAVASLGLRSTVPVNIDFVTSSVGSLTDEFLRSIYLAAKGDDGLTEYTLRTEKKSAAKDPGDSNKANQKSILEEWKSRFRVYFPSLETVRSSKGGTNAAGTICFTSRWWEGPKFPRHVLRDCISRREGVLMHNKMLFVRPDKSVSLPDGSMSNGWAYVGSANLSESAWGRLVQDRTLKAPKLNCRNWECGVLIPVIRKESIEEGDPITSTAAPSDTASATSKTKAEDVDIATIFKDIVPVPMRVPAPTYGTNKRPWFNAEDS